MAGNNIKPMTSKQAKKAYKARGGVAQLTELQKRQQERQQELQKRADEIKEKAERAKENKRKKAEKDAKTAEMRAKQGLPPVPLPKVAASQPRLMAFLGQNGQKGAQQGAKELNEAEEEGGEAVKVAEEDDEDEGGAGSDEPPNAVESWVQDVAEKSAIEFDGDDAAEFADFWDGVRSQGITKKLAASQQQTSPRLVTRKRRHSATFTRANTLVARLPAAVMDLDVYVNPRDLYVPPSQNTLAHKRPHSAGQVDVSGWKEETAARAQLAARPQSAHVIGSQFPYGNPVAASAVEQPAPVEAMESAVEPWDEEGQAMSLNDEFAALRKSARQLQEHQEKFKQDSRQTSHQAEASVASELELVTNHIDDWFVDDSQLQLSGIPQPSQSEARPAVAQGPQLSIPIRLSQSVPRAAQHEGRRGSSTNLDKLKTAHQRDLDLASLLPDDSEVFLTPAEARAQQPGVFPTHPQAFAEQVALELDAGMFPSDSQALESPVQVEDGSAGTQQRPMNDQRRPALELKTATNEEMEDLFEGMTASQLEAFDGDIEHGQPSPSQQIVEVTTHDTDFGFSPDLDLSEDQMAELEAQARRTSRTQTPVQNASKPNIEPENDEFGTFEVSTQELRELLP